MYDGINIDVGEMNEWLDDTIETIIHSGPYSRLLEIGTGSGMILFNLVNGLHSYVGLEPSARAVEFTARIAASVPDVMDKVKIFKATAADILRLDTPVSPEFVVLNSVIQYFPSQEYLLKVIQDLLQLESVKTIFFGDVRSFALHEEFLAMRALHISGDNTIKEEVRQIITNLKRAEPELLVDPSFFTSLPSRLPGFFEHVEILPKRMHATNELSCYRYGAILHVNSRHKIREICPESWIDFTTERLDRSSLLALLNHESKPAIVSVSNIPHSKNVFARDVIKSLGEHEHGREQDNWLSVVRQNAQSCSSLSPIELSELAEQAGYCVEISWARQYSQRGALDAISFTTTTQRVAKAGLCSDSLTIIKTGLTIRSAVSH